MRGVILLALLWLGSAVDAIEFTAEEQQFIRDHPTIRVVEFFEEPPFTLNGGRHRGYLYQLLGMALERVGLELRYVAGYATYNAMLEGLEAGEVDLLTTLEQRYPLPAGSRIIKTQPVVTTPYVVVGKRDRAGLTEPAALVGKRVAVVKGYAQDMLLDRIPGAIKVHVQDNQAGFEAVRADRADYFLNNRANAEYVILRQFANDLSILGELPYDTFPPLTISFGLHQDDAPLATILQKGLAQIPIAELQRLSDQWLSAQPSRPDQPSQSMEGYRGIARQMSFTLGESLWSYRRDKIEEILHHAVQNYWLQAAVVFDEEVKEYHAAWLEDGAIRYAVSDQSPGLDGLTSWSPLRQPLEYEGTHLGTLTLYLKPKQGPLELSPQEQQFFRDHPVIRLGVTANWPPFDLVDEGGNHLGINAEYLALLNQLLPATLEPAISGEWRAVIEAARGGYSHGVMAMPITPNHADDFLFTETYAKNPIVLIARTGTNFSSLAAVGQLVTVSGNDFSRELRDHPELRVAYHGTTLECFNAVLAGRADAYIGWLADAQFLLKEYAISDLGVTMYLPSEQQNLRIGVRKELPLLHSALDKALEAISPQQRIKIGTDWTGAEEGVASDLRLQLNQEEIDWLREHPVIRVSNELDWPPFDFAIGGQAQGYSVDLLRLIARRLGVRLQFVSGHSWDQLYRMFQNRELDIAQPVYMSAERRQYGPFSNPLYVGKSVFVSRFEGPDIEDINDLRGKRVAIPEGWATVEFLRQRFPEINLVLTRNLEESLRALIDGRADATVEMDAVVQYVIDQQMRRDLKISGWFRQFDQEKHNSLHYQIRGDWELFHQLFIKAQNSITPAEIRQLQQRWFGRFGDGVNLALEVEERSYLDTRPSLRMAVDPDWMPIEYIDDQQVHQGMVAAILKLISERTGLGFTLVPTETWAESLELSRNGGVEMLSGVSITEERRRYLRFSDPYLQLPDVVVMRQEEQILFDLNQLRGRKVGLKFGNALHRYIVENHPDLDLVSMRSTTDGLNALSGGGIDAWLDNLFVVGHRINHDGLFNLKVAFRLPNERELHIAVNQEVPEVALAIINKAIASLGQEEMGEIFNQWISLKIEEQIDYTLIWQITLASALVLVGTVYWNRRLARLNHRVLLSNLELQQAQAALQMEVRRRQEHEVTLQQAKREAEQASRAKSEFLANMSHEIRTPLNAVIGFAELLELTEVTVRQKSYLESIKSGGKTLLCIINDILDLSKIEAGKFGVRSEPTPLRAILGDIARMFSPQAEERKIEIVLSIDERLPEWLMLDETRMRQVMFNLVGNAIKFTDRGQIEISARLEPGTAGEGERAGLADGLIIDVRDSGRGIPADQLERIFEAFEQQDGQSSRKYGGTGLGLTISRKLVEAMGGRLSAASVEGEGSTFSIVLRPLPLVRSGKDVATADIDQPLRVTRFAPATLLVADDVPSNRDLIRSALEGLQLRIIEVTDGQQALESCARERPDLVLMDIRMPNLDGISATRAIRQQPDLASIPVVAITASMSAHDRGVDATLFDGYLHKPVTYRELIGELSRHLAQESDPIDRPATDPAVAIGLPEIEPEQFVAAIEREVCPLFERASASGSFDDVAAFAAAMSRLGERHALVGLSDYAARIDDAQAEFDIKSIESLLQSFPTLQAQWRSEYHG